MFLGGKRKPENPEETHADIGWPELRTEVEDYSDVSHE